MKPQVRILVEVEAAELRKIPFTDKKTGEPRTIYSQPVVAFVGSSKYPDKFEIIHGSVADAFPPGRYFAHQLRVTRNGRIEVDLTQLQPAKAEAAA